MKHKSNFNGHFIAGTADQIADRYHQLARQEADGVLKQCYLQHAEHYIRVAKNDRSVGFSNQRRK